MDVIINDFVTEVKKPKTIIKLIEFVFLCVALGTFFDSSNKCDDTHNFIGGTLMTAFTFAFIVSICYLCGQDLGKTFIEPLFSLWLLLCLFMSSILLMVHGSRSDGTATQTTSGVFCLFMCGLYVTDIVLYVRKHGTPFTGGMAAGEDD
ncbi:unnamed protein product [Meganyctiphanes norvegica]|uniref:MARVEL domain-containing protein n=1 Tax=Meganyctiphanes norvegica TaxID=48144 RepID=A0AAV2QXK5_MEGNR